MSFSFSKYQKLQTGPLIAHISACLHLIQKGPGRKASCKVSGIEADYFFNSCNSFIIKIDL